MILPDEDDSATKSSTQSPQPLAPELTPSSTQPHRPAPTPEVDGGIVVEVAPPPSYPGLGHITQPYSLVYPGRVVGGSEFDPLYVSTRPRVATVNLKNGESAGRRFLKAFATAWVVLLLVSMMLDYVITLAIVASRLGRVRRHIHFYRSTAIVPSFILIDIDVGT